MEEENKNLEGTATPTPEAIDYEKIISVVLSKMQEGKKEEEKIDNPTITTQNEDYMKKSVEFEMKYNTLNEENSKLRKQLEEINNKLSESNNKLKEYETFGKTADDIKETTRIVNDYKKTQNGLIKL